MGNLPAGMQASRAGTSGRTEGLVGPPPPLQGKRKMEGVAPCRGLEEESVWDWKLFSVAQIGGMSSGRGKSFRAA